MDNSHSIRTHKQADRQHRRDRLRFQSRPVPGPASGPAGSSESPAALNLSCNAYSPPALNPAIHVLGSRSLSNSSYLLERLEARKGSRIGLADFNHPAHFQPVTGSRTTALHTRRFTDGR